MQYDNAKNETAKPPISQSQLLANLANSLQSTCPKNRRRQIQIQNERPQVRSLTPFLFIPTKAGRVPTFLVNMASPGSSTS